MLDLSQLWIGENVKLIKSGRVGTFEGIVNGKAKVKINGKIILSSPQNLKIHILEKKDFFNHSLKTDPVPDPSLESNILDLHLEALNPSLINSRPERILHYQIECARILIEKAILSKYASIEIIHGKGKGVLKAEIKHLTTLYKEVKWCFDKNDGGAVEIIFY